MISAMNDSPNPGDPHWDEPWERDVGDRLARQTFATSFDAEPTAVWSAPGRVNLIGEHTDYNGGLCVPAPLPHRTYVAGAPRTDRVLRIASAEGREFAGPGEVFEIAIDDLTPDACDGWPAFVAGVVWSLVERGYDGPGLDLATTTCVPRNAGLASSAALACSTALAVNDLWRLALDNPENRVELAEAARDAENVVVGTPTGRLDHYAALFSHPGTALLVDCSTSPPGLHHHPLTLHEYGLEILVIDTRTTHDLTDGRYARRTEECARAAAALGAPSLREVADAPNGVSRVEGLDDPILRRRARHVVTEIHRVRAVVDELAGVGPAHERFAEIGRQFSLSHASLARDFEVSRTELDLAVDAVNAAGALGSRLVGAGFGGAVIALVRRVQLASLASAVDQAFVQRGFERPRFLHL
jgi:galactokinase